MLWQLGYQVLLQKEEKPEAAGKETQEEEQWHVLPPLSARPKEVGWHASKAAPSGSFSAQEEKETPQTGTAESQELPSVGAVQVCQVHLCWAGKCAWKRAWSSSVTQSLERGCSRQHSHSRPVAKHRGPSLAGATQGKGKPEPGLGVVESTKSAPVINARLAHQQKVGQLECQHQ